MPAIPFPWEDIYRTAEGALVAGIDLNALRAMASATVAHAPKPGLARSIRDPGPLLCCGFTPADEALLHQHLAPHLPHVPVIAARHYFSPAVTRAVAQCDGRTLLVCPVGPVLWAGPMLEPGGLTLAYVRARLRRAMRVAELLARQQARHVHMASVEPEATGFGTLRMLLGRPTRLRDRLMLVPRSEGETTIHPLFCTAPLATTTVSPGPDGGYRALSAPAAWRRLRPHVDSVTGLVASVVREPAAGGLPLYRAAYAANLHPGTRAQATALSWSAGKGLTASQARMSAAAEALERTCSAFHGDEPVTVAPLADVPGALAPDALLHLSAAQRAQGGEIPHEGPMPPPHDPAQPLWWTPAASLVTGSVHHVPTAWAFFHTPDPVGRRCCTADSNGWAAGSTREEAMLQGLLELVERDASAVWWYNRLRQPGVDLEGFDHPFARRLLRAARRLGRDVWALDLTHDLGVPAFAAVSVHTGSHARPLFGFGCHLDPSVALLRALTELVQALPATPEHDRPRGRTASARAWHGAATLEAHPELVPDPARPLVRVPAAPGPLPPSLDAALAHLLDRIAPASEVLWLDGTRAGSPLAVVRMIAPTLRPHWRRFAPGRLYTVPVALGWTPAPTPEASLNPAPLVC